MAIPARKKKAIINGTRNNIGKGFLLVFILILKETIKDKIKAIIFTK